MPALNVPQEDREGLAKLVLLSKESIDELLSALVEASPSVDANELASIISTKTKTIPQEDIRPIAVTVVSFYYARAYLGYSIPDFAKAICDAVSQGVVETKKLSDDECGRFQDDLVRILSVDPLASKIKARTLLREYEHILCDVRVLTDLRPVFGSNPAEPPTGAGIVHTLRIRYHEGIETKEFFVILDSDEIEGLRQSMERAKLKAESLQSVLKVAGIPYITVE
jgi:hypothetical protein